MNKWKFIGKIGDETVVALMANSAMISAISKRFSLNDSDLFRWKI